MIRVLHGDCYGALRAIPDASVDAVVTDPPYGLAGHKPATITAALTAWTSGDREHVPDGHGFMGRKWDGFVPPPAVWDECLRVLKPGGHLLAFAGSRTADLMGMSVRLAGFEIRDTITWLYGCLDDQTEIMIDGQWERWDTAKQGRHALCYDLERDEYVWQPIQRVVSFPHSDTAYRLVGNHTDQLVTRDHRCLVERGGNLVFEQAEEAARQREAHVPVLEDVQGLLDALPLPDQGTSDTKHDLREDVCGCSRRHQQPRATECASEPAPALPLVREALPPGADEAPRNPSPGLLTEVPRCPGCRPAPHVGTVGPLRVDDSIDGVVPLENDRRAEPSLEGRGDGLPEEGELHRGPVRAGSRVGEADGAQGRLRHGAPAVRGAGHRPASDPCRGGASRGSRPVEQCTGELGAVQDEQGSQAVRASWFTRTDLARFEPVQYDGIAWCITVRTGAFVARRNGKVFVTGNSGFPKSLDVSKAIDATLVHGKSNSVGLKATNGSRPGEGRSRASTMNNGIMGEDRASPKVTRDEPETDATQQWQGWGTALKPAHEPIIVARKPLAGTVAANVLAHGTGALNINRCRVTHASAADLAESEGKNQHARYGSAPGATNTYGTFTDAHVRDYSGTAVRWPTNVVLTHGETCQDVCVEGCPVAELDQQSGVTKSTAHRRGNGIGDGYHGSAAEWVGVRGTSDSGGASRFFPTFRYQAKAPTRERPKVDGVAHPTVKPLALMVWLVRLVTPPGGTVLDPFAGSGTTGQAAHVEGFQAILVERETAYLPLIAARLGEIPHTIEVVTQPPDPVRTLIAAARTSADLVAVITGTPGADWTAEHTAAVEARMAELGVVA